MEVNMEIKSDSMKNVERKKNNPKIMNLLWKATLNISVLITFKIMKNYV